MLRARLMQSLITFCTVSLYQTLSLFRLKDLRFQIDKQNGTHGFAVAVDVDAVVVDAAVAVHERGEATAIAGRAQQAPMPSAV